MADIIRAHGLLWHAENVFWGDGSNRGRLLGVSARAKSGAPIDFSRQAGIYVLYRAHEMVYVGQTGSGKQRLFSRLRRHRKDRLSGRWDRFSWFGLCYPLKKKLSTPNKRMRSALPVTLNQMEAILLAAAEPTLNRQGGRFGRSSVRYVQCRDEEHLGPTQEEMIQEVWDWIQEEKG